MARDGTPVTVTNPEEFGSGGGSTGTNGSAAPTTGTLVMGSDGTNARTVLTDSSGRLQVAGNGGSFTVNGNSAPGATDSGNPVKIGGYASSAAPAAVTTGQRVNAWYGLNGQAIVALGAGGQGDGASPSSIGAYGIDGNTYPLGVMLRTFNGGSSDRVRDATSANGTTGTGLLGAGMLGFDGTNYQRLGTAAATNDTSAGLSLLAISQNYFNGTSFSRARGDTSGAWTKAPPLVGTDRSITAGPTAQTLMAANTTRSKFYVKNDSTADVWINIGGTAAATAGSGNLKIQANGGYLEMTGTASAVSIFATAAAAVAAREF